MEKEIVEEEIDLRDYLRVLEKKKFLIVSIIIVSLISSFYYLFFMLQNEYQTDAILYIKNLSADFSNAERYTIPAVIVTITSYDTAIKTVEQSNLAEVKPFKDSKSPENSAMTWLTGNIKVETKDMLKLSDRQIKITLTGTEPETLQRVLQTHLEVVREENKQKLNRDVQREMDKIDALSASLIEQRASILNSIEKIPEVNSSERVVVMLQLFMTLNSRLTAIEDRLNALQISKKNIELLTSPDFNWIEVMSTPYKPENPIGPRRMLNMAIAAVLGLFIGVFAAFFKNYLEESASR